MTVVVQQAITEVGKILLGKEQQVKLAISCLLAQGHLLIEDLPGMGKTTLAHALAQVLGLSYQRIQFTSDMLPADILGISIFDKNTSNFTFHPGPIFTQLLLADEINRTTPKTQSALLEAMEEGQVTVENETRALPDPFFVIATQNPSSQSGTYLLPESQLDRFLMCIELGYPDPKSERLLFEGLEPRSELKKLKSCMSLDQLHQYQKAIEQVVTSASLLDYVQRLVHFTRTSPELGWGLSPRGALAVVKSAKAWAYLDGRNHVVPEDVQAVFPSVAVHRLRDGVSLSSVGKNGLADFILHSVDVVG